MDSQDQSAENVADTDKLDGVDAVITSHPLGDRPTGMADHSDERGALAPMFADMAVDAVTADDIQRQADEMAAEHPTSEHVEPDPTENPADAFQKALRIEAEQAGTDKG